MTDKIQDIVTKSVSDALTLNDQGVLYQVIQFPHCQGNLDELKNTVELFLSRDTKLLDLGFLFLSGNQNNLSYMCRIGLALQSQNNFSPSDWVDYVHLNLSDSSCTWQRNGQRDEQRDEQRNGQRDENNREGSLLVTDGYPDKIREEFAAHAFSVLRQQKLLPPPEEEYIVDLEAAGLSSW